MTAEEIRAANFFCDDGAYESARWLQEIAAQLAELNQQIRSVIKPETKDENAGIRLDQPVATRNW